MSNNTKPAAKKFVYTPAPIKEIDLLCSNGWTVQDKGDSKTVIHKEFKFPGFKKAFAFMTTVAQSAETLKHHPEWTNVYNRVSVDLTTHCADPPNSLTTHDVDLAWACEEAIGNSRLQQEEK